MKKQREKGSDPLLRPCPACGARRGKGCQVVGNNSKLIARASRLVHADRLGGTSDA